MGKGVGPSEKAETLNTDAKAAQKLGEDARDELDAVQKDSHDWLRATENARSMTVPYSAWAGSTGIVG